MPRAVLKGAVAPTLAIALAASLFDASLVVGQPSAGDSALAKHAAKSEPFASRTPWTTSRITGSPEPPLPFRVERVAPKLAFSGPTFVEFAPDGERVFVGEQQGKVWSFPIDAPGEKADLAIDLKAEIKSYPAADVKGVGAVYDLCFDPEFARNRFVYLTYTLLAHSGKPLPDGTRVSRFRLTDAEPPRIDRTSEKIVITWLEGGHNGGCLAFGNDGRLYISSGDAASPNPPDVLGTGQDCSDLLSSILRVDVRATENDPRKGYVVPDDNPFVKTSGVRPEIWAFGFRNPWKMSFDRPTGDLWVGDVGWELWELVDRVEKGGNYGWSIVEGRQPVRQDVKLGPSPVLPPTLDFPHSESASITGGFVYRGKQFPELVGWYVCGDWETRRMWAAKWEDGRIVEKKSIAEDTVRIVDFGQDAEGELYVLDYGDQAGLYKLVRNEVDPNQATRFPRKLSETGLFADVTNHMLAPGVAPFSVNAAQWNDGALAERFVGLPNDSTVTIHDQAKWIPGSMFSAKTFFPKDGVLGRTFSIETTPGVASSRRRIETQIMHFDGKSWRGYSYRWNEDQTDAELVPAEGRDESFAIADAAARGLRAGEKSSAPTRTQRWRYPSRTECLQCHNPWSGQALAFTLPQLHRAAEPAVSPSGENQIAVFKRLKMLETPDAKEPVALADPHGSGPIDARARSYLHVNCSHCHQMGAGGSVDIDLRAELPRDKLKIVDVKPAQGTFGIADAKIVAAGRPFHSVLYYRMAKQGRGRMPHIGSEVVDERGLAVIHDWIQSLAPDQTRGEVLAMTALNRVIAVQAETTDAPARAEAEAKAFGELFADPSAALFVAKHLEGPTVEPKLKERLIAFARTLPPGATRDLFERFFPEGDRAERLGASFDRAKLLAIAGDAEAGRRVFFETAGLSCKNCHKIAGVDSSAAGEVGPELTAVGKKLSREQLLESLVEPSKTIDPKFAGYAVETSDGRSLVGRLVERTAERLTLRDPQGKEAVVEAADVESFVPLSTSLMPERLLQDLTPKQAADLLAYLQSLKGE